MARRRLNVFSLSFLDAMTCGFGAVVLFYMIINASVGLRAGQRTADLQGEVNRLETLVLEGHEDLVELRNTTRETEEQAVVARGLATRLIEQLEEIRVELATYEASSLSKREHINRLQSDLQTLEKDAKRLSAAAPTDEIPGDRLRRFVGDGDRQYLTGLKVGGERIAIVVDASASMLDETIVNIIRRRNLPDAVKAAGRQVAPRGRHGGLADDAAAALEPFSIADVQRGRRPARRGWGRRLARRRKPRRSGASGRRAASDRTDRRDQPPSGLRSTRRPPPAPDNVILLVDGLPTIGAEAPRKRTISGKKRGKLFEDAVRRIPRGVPINVIMFPMEGDPMAASAYWNLAVSTRGSYMSPSKDWP